ncbi:MAG: type II toxin-antitoxin system RelE/ParE family toxin [Xanthobacteraceae bacterium]
MTKTFADKRTATLFSSRHAKGLPTDVAERAKRRLDLIDSAATMSFLRVPPGSRLEALTGNRAGQHSIRVNDQWRICFTGGTGMPTMWNSAIIIERPK